MSDFFQLVNQRESCRNYDPDKRPTKEQLINCIKAAQLAPSACNSQPWSFIVINDPELSKDAAPCMQIRGLNKFTEKCPSFIVVCEEDAMLIGRSEPDQKYASIDIGIAVAHLCYAATQQGLSTCIMGAFDPGSSVKGSGHHRTKESSSGDCGWLCCNRAAASKTPQRAGRDHDLSLKTGAA